MFIDLVQQMFDGGLFWLHRKHIHVEMSFKYRIVPIILWKIYKDCLIETIFLQR